METLIFRHSSQLLNLAEILICSKIKLIRDFMEVLVTCNNEEDRIKNEATRVLTRLYVDLSDTQWQLTPHSVAESN